MPQYLIEGSFSDEDAACFVLFAPYVGRLEKVRGKLIERALASHSHLGVRRDPSVVASQAPNRG